MGQTQSNQPGGPPSIQRLAVGALLVAAMVATFFLVTPYLSQEYNSPVAQPSPTSTPLPPTDTPLPTGTPLPTRTATVTGTPPTPTPFAGLTTGALSRLALDPKDLSGWTGLNWSLVSSSDRLDAISSDLRLLANLQDLNLQGSLVQDFEQDGGACAQTFCQIAWVGIVFNSPEDAYQALVLLNLGDNSNSIIPELKPDARQGHPAPTAGASGSSANPRPSITSLDYHWSNLFVRVSVLSPSRLTLDQTERAMELVYSISTSLYRQWSHNIQMINAP